MVQPVYCFHGYIIAWPLAITIRTSIGFTVDTMRVHEREENYNKYKYKNNSKLVEKTEWSLLEAIRFQRKC